MNNPEQNKPCKGCLLESRTGETLRYTYHICEKGNVVPARYAKDIPGYQNAFDYPMKPESPEPWEEEFDKDFFYVGRCGREGVIEGKNGGMVFDEKGSQFGAIKAFIRKVEQEAYERGKKEVVAILEMNLDLGKGEIYSDSEAQYKNRTLIELIKNLARKS